MRTNIEQIIEVNATQESVFAAFSNPINIPRWLPTVTAVQPFDDGTTCLLLASPHGEKATVYVEPFAHESPRSIRWHITDANQHAEDLTVEFTETRRNSTLVRFAVKDDADAYLLPMLFGNNGDLQQSLQTPIARFKEFAENHADETLTSERTLVRARRENHASAENHTSTGTFATATGTSLPAPESRTTTPLQGYERDIVDAPVRAPRTANESRLGQNFDAYGTRQSRIAMPSASYSDVTHTRPNNSLRWLIIALSVLLLGILVYALMNEQDADNATTPIAANTVANVAANDDDAPPSNLTNLSNSPDVAPSNREPVANIFSSSDVDNRNRNSSNRNQQSLANSNDNDFIAPDATRARANANVAGAIVTNESRMLRSQLDSWIAATNGRDVEAQSAFYAARLERYYLQRNYSRQSVIADKRRLAARERAINISISNPEITFSPDGRKATMRFRKEFNVGNSGRRDAVIQELIWVKTPDGWRITSERDIKIV